MKRQRLGLEQNIFYPAMEHDATHYLEVVDVEQLGNETMIAFDELDGSIMECEMARSMDDSIQVIKFQ